jgi:hypothetical protein
MLGCTIDFTDVPEKYKLVYSTLHVLDLQSMFPQFVARKLTDAIFTTDFSAADSMVASSIDWEQPCEREWFSKQLKAAIGEIAKRRRSGRLNHLDPTSPATPMTSQGPPPSTSHGVAINNGTIGAITNNHFLGPNRAAGALPDTRTVALNPVGAASPAVQAIASVSIPLPLSTKIKNRIDEIVKVRLITGFTLMKQRNVDVVLKQLYRVLQLEFEYSLCDKITNGVPDVDPVVDANQKIVKKHISHWLTNARSYSRKKQNGIKTPTECRRIVEKMKVGEK